MKKIFIDTNIIIDLLIKRDGYIASAKILALAKDNDVTLYSSVLTMANIAYILRKSFVGDGLYQQMMKLSNILCVSDLTKKQFEQAISLKARDFEDALQYYCAMDNSCDVIITRNKKDFTFSTITVLTPEEYFDTEKHC
ncbi:MAG: PIN domain-containing protein [Prevotella sp.]|nr:PIN domain-containing protein [Prevotella sp.]